MWTGREPCRAAEPPPIDDVLVAADEAQRHQALGAVAVRHDLQLAVALQLGQALALRVRPVRELPLQLRDLVSRLHRHR